MRKILSTIGAGLISCACLAGPVQNYIEIPMGTNTSDSATVSINGYIDAVYVAVSDAVSTGAVTVSYAPLLGSTAINIATNIVTDEQVFRPVVDVTTVAGVDLTSDEPTRFALAGEVVTFAVASSPTGITWKCQIIADREN